MAVYIHNALDMEKVDPRLEDLALRVADRLSIHPDASVNIVLTDDAHMTALNSEYLGSSNSTDCIAFNIDAQKPAVGEWVFGEVYVGMEVAERQGAEAGWGKDKELAMLIIHGLLHLTGRKDDSDECREAMMAEAMGLLAEFWEEGK